MKTKSKTGQGGQGEIRTRSGRRRKEGRCVYVCVCVYVWYLYDMVECIFIHFLCIFIHFLWIEIENHFQIQIPTEAPQKATEHGTHIYITRSRPHSPQIIPSDHSPLQQDHKIGTSTATDAPEFQPERSAAQLRSNTSFSREPPKRSGSGTPAERPPASALYVFRRSVVLYWFNWIGLKKHQ